jgi:hypothetical protein
MDHGSTDIDLIKSDIRSTMDMDHGSFRVLVDLIKSVDADMAWVVLGQVIVHVDWCNP